jgi:acyl-CoA oxidase
MPDEHIKNILFGLCMVYGISNIIARSNFLIESAGIEPHHLESLRARLQSLLKSLRPHVMGLVDGFGLPDSCLRSALVTSP